jgi:hypothetical protein
MALLRQCSKLAARRTCLHRVLSNASVLFVGVGLILSLYCKVQAQTVACGSKAYLDSLPVKPRRIPTSNDRCS